METVKLGRTGPAVGALGLGCMGMSPGIYGPSDEPEGIATIRAALDAGVTLISGLCDGSYDAGACGHGIVSREPAEAGMSAKCISIVDLSGPGISI